MDTENTRFPPEQALAGGFVRRFEIGKNGMVWMIRDHNFYHPTSNGVKMPLVAYGTDKQGVLAAYEAMWQEYGSLIRPRSRSTSFQV